MARPRVIAVTVRDYRARHRTNRINGEIARRAMEPVRRRAKQLFGSGHRS
jgi:hypothetical protein